jgi:hypothetical protein
MPNVKGATKWPEFDLFNHLGFGSKRITTKWEELEKKMS